MIKISVAIITLNEGKNIKRCIESVSDIADEIVVVDSLSTDDTKDICLSYGINFIEQKFLGHIEQKNFAIDQCKYDYILSLDADEALDQKLISQIKAIKNDFNADAYSFNRLTRYVDKWIYNCGWYPDKKTRLFKKSLARWGGVNPHDIIIMEPGSKTVHLEGNLLHYSYVSISDHVNQTNKFTTIAAKEAYDKGVKSNNFKIVTRPILKFVKDYILKKGFMDGRYGFIICCINALSALLKYSKIKDLQENKVIK